MNFKGMITDESELTIGRELWHVYGHLNREAMKVKIASPIMISDPLGYRYVQVEHLGCINYISDMYMGDVGINKNHNMNRLFETEEDALAFYDSPECITYRGHYGKFYNEKWDAELDDLVWDEL